MTRIITNAYFRDETDVSNSVEDVAIDRKIVKAHDQLQFILGRNFYNQIVSQATTLPTTFSTENAALFDPYIKQYLAWQAYEYYIVNANSYDTRMGRRVFKEANSDPVDAKTIGEMISRAKEDSLFYKGNLINFLVEAQKLNSASYPIYTDKFPQSKMGPSFQITAVQGRDHRFSRINTKTVLNSDATKNDGRYQNGYRTW